jgi:hypothetical protein
MDTTPEYFNWIAGGLAIGLLAASFLMMFTTVFTGRRKN